ncbi:MAG: IS5 family transposase [Acidobacteriaceae bacterium]
MYPSDLRDRQWATLEPLLKELRGKRHTGGRPRKYELRRVVDALLYVVKTCCQWRQLPADFPPWQSVHQQFRAWRDNGAWEGIGNALREQGRKAKGRNAAPSVVIVDSQSVKTAVKLPSTTQVSERGSTRPEPMT